MYNDINSYIRCEVCGGDVSFDFVETKKSYTQLILSDINSIDTILEDVACDFMVFNCYDCGSKFRYSSIEVESIVRKNIIRNIIDLVARGIITDNYRPKDKFFKVYKYCGVCSGYDGKGSCPLTIFDDCKLKKVFNG